MGTIGQDLSGKINPPPPAPAPAGGVASQMANLKTRYGAALKSIKGKKQNGPKA